MANTDNLMERYDEHLSLIRDESSVEVPLSEADMREMERELGVQLPSDFRRFIARYNGLETWAQIPVKAPVTTNPVSLVPTVFRWIKFNPGEIKKTVELIKQVHWGESTMPEGCLGFVNGLEDESPIGIVLQGEHIGEIRFLDYFKWGFAKAALFEGKPTPLPSIEDLPLIASSFEEFFFRLQPRVDEDDE